MFPRTLIPAGVFFLVLAGSACNPPGNSEPRFQFPFSKKPETAPGPEKVVLPGMVAAGEDLSAAITGCAGQAAARLDAMQPAPAGNAPNRQSFSVTVSGGFQEVAGLVACFAGGEVVWELGDLRVWRGPPKFFDYRIELAVSAYQELTIPGPKFQTRAEAEKWFQGLPARARTAAALLSDIYLTTEPAMELREIGLSARQGSLKGRAMNYEEISGLMQELQAKGLVRNARVETIRRIKARNVEKDQEFELRFDW